MSKDTSPGGLLSKVVRFVKNPTATWAESEVRETERDSTYSKQALKEMIERKRRNDFVRKREFDMLRKLRRREALGNTDPTARPSFFQSSMPSKPDDRAMTLKKIDEIEAQMSMQWWKTKNPAASSLPHSVPPPTQPPAGAPTVDPEAVRADYERTEPQPLPDRVKQPPAAPQVAPMLDLGLTEPAKPAVAPAAAARPAAGTPKPAAPAAAARPPAAAPTARPAPAAAAPAPAAAPGKAPLLNGLSASYDAAGAASGFSASKLFAVEVAEVAHDAELEEASIRFANGDDAAAEAGLLEALSPQGTRANHEDTWLTLFDLYRATGQQERFDAAAIDFASRFGRSAPLWFSIPEMVERMTPVAPHAAAANRSADWVCPPTLEAQSLAVLGATLAKAASPWQLDWSRLQSIEPRACEPLMRLFTQWASQPVQLRFVAAERLEAVLKEATPSGNRQVGETWWKLRMEALRMMHRPDEFELVALDYCVTYEVSPPSWERSRCDFKAVGADGVSGATIIGEAFRDSVPSSLPSGGFGDTEAGGMTGPLAQLSAVELAGQVTGDAQAALDRLETKLLGADIMVISCAKLIRVDFSAAGTLLNWVTARQAEGRHVQFSDVHRLVAAFFNVIGISEHARVIPRGD